MNKKTKIKPIFLIVLSVVLLFIVLGFFALPEFVPILAVGVVLITLISLKLMGL